MAPPKRPRLSDVVETEISNPDEAPHQEHDGDGDRVREKPQSTPGLRELPTTPDVLRVRGDVEVSVYKYAMLVDVT